MLQFDLEKACAGMKLTYEQFVDVCILAGCDYADSIKGESRIARTWVGQRQQEVRMIARRPRRCADARQRALLSPLCPNAPRQASPRRPRLSS